MSRPNRRVWFGRPSDHRPNDALAKPRDRFELAVVFEDPASYRPYIPGTGPRLRPITLVPPRDSTAYIRDEFFLSPALSKDGKKRLQYIVGWTDLPAARLIIDAETIADYVSPAAYEEWCAARAEERDEEERRKEAEENVRAVVEAEARETGRAVAKKTTRGWKGGKRKRRPRADDTSRAETPVAEEGAKRKPGRPRKNAPSLSTPSKARLEAFAELETEAEPGTDANDEEAIFMQLTGEQLAGNEDELAGEEYESSNGSIGPTRSGPPTKKPRTISPGPAILRLLPGIETDSGRSTPFESSTGGTSSPALPPLPQPQGAPQPTLSLAQSALPSLAQASVNQTSTPNDIPRTVNPPKRSLLSMRDPPSSPALHSSNTQTPKPNPYKPLPPPPSQQSPAAAATPPTNGRISTTPVPLPKIAGFTPLGHSSKPRNTPVRTTDRRAASLSTPIPPPKLQTNPSPRSTIVARPDPDLDELADSNVYEVSRLEGTQVRNVDGKLVRFFAVRWKGNWPPGQNPTWEPEENIPPAITAKYMRRHPTPAPQRKGTLHQYLSPSGPWSQRKYSSVSEAFEGGDTPQPGEDKAEDEAEGESGDEEEELLLVTDEPTDHKPPPTLSW